MRCLACNDLLTDREATRKSSVTGAFIDLCDNCIGGTGISYSESIYSDELEKIENDDADSMGLD